MRFQVRLRGGALIVLRMIIVTCGVVACQRLASAADWPAWRGPTGMGDTTEKNLPLTWGKDTKVRWRASLPGQDRKAAQDQNQSSPIVIRGRVFITASYWPAKQDPSEYPEHHVACYGADSGKLLWDVKVTPG